MITDNWDSTVQHLNNNNKNMKPCFLSCVPSRWAIPARPGQHGGARPEQLQQWRGSHGSHHELVGDWREHGSFRGLRGLTLAFLEGGRWGLHRLSAPLCPLVLFCCRLPRNWKFGFREWSGLAQLKPLDPRDGGCRHKMVNLNHRGIHSSSGGNGNSSKLHKNHYQLDQPKCSNKKQGEGS